MRMVAIDAAEVPVSEGPDPMERLEALYRSEHQGAVHLALLLTGDHAVAQELAQEAFVRVAPRLDQTDNPGGYLRTTLVNLCRDHGRRQATVRRHPDAPPAVAPAPDLPADVGEVWLAVQALPEHQREVLVLRYWTDLRTEEIARLLGVPHPTVRSRIRRGLASLQEVLTDA